MVALEDDRYQITEEIVDGTSPEGYQITSDLWINLADIPITYGNRNIRETWTENMRGQLVMVRRLENEMLEIGDSSFEAIVVVIMPMDPSMRWMLVKYLSYEVPITPFISTRRITWEIGPGKCAFHRICFGLTGEEVRVAHPNPNSRLETFCDGVFAIALTLLVLDIRIPPTTTITTTSELWLSLARLLPSIFAFLLSFCIIFITWANHHATLSVIDKTSSHFIYANGFLLLTVVLIPFTAALLGEYLLTDHASPAVVLYTAVNALQAVAWIFLTHADLRPEPLTTSEISRGAIRMARRKREPLGRNQVSSLLL